jgi:hypothetical protein
VQAAHEHRREALAACFAVSGDQLGQAAEALHPFTLDLGLFAEREDGGQADLPIGRAGVIRQRQQARVLGIGDLVYCLFVEF